MRIRTEQISNYQQGLPLTYAYISDLEINYINSNTLIISQGLVCALSDLSIFELLTNLSVDTSSLSTVGWYDLYIGKDINDNTDYELILNPSGSPFTSPSTLAKFRKIISLYIENTSGNIRPFIMTMQGNMQEILWDSNMDDIPTGGRRIISTEISVNNISLTEWIPDETKFINLGYEMSGSGILGNGELGILNENGTQTKYIKSQSGLSTNYCESYIKSYSDKTIDIVVSGGTAKLYAIGYKELI